MPVKPRKKSAPKTAPEFCIAAIGASAGGLSAMKLLCAGLPAEPDLAVVMVFHRDPDANSNLQEILARECALPIVSINQNTLIQRNHIYLAPAGQFLAAVDGELRPTKPQHDDRCHMPIDFLFRSLAHSYAEKAIAIVLSGSGTDGALGLQAIKAAGGLTMAQSLQEAEHPSMPQHAVATGSVDLMLEAGRIGAELTKYVAHPYVVKRAVETATPSKENALMGRIFALLRHQTGHDFSNYKIGTMTRRVERRMAIHQIGKLHDYVRYLSQTPKEVDTLFKELLINVTSFFRDPESFEVLKQRVLSQLFAGREATAPVRVWVPGCATGEEAYSIAISLLETAEALDVPCRAQIFATDIHDVSLETARSGRYPEAIAADVTKQRLERFFTKEDGFYSVSKQVREMVIVAKQDLIKDPPFSKLDLIVCRNLLIYLNATLHKKILPLFHYSLNNGGVLMLGPSESIGGGSELFSVIDKRWRVYERRSVPRAAIELPSTLLLRDTQPVTRFSSPASQMETVGQLAGKALLETYAPPCVVVNERYDIVHFHGTTAPYLEPPSGEPTLNLLRMAKEDLRVELRSILHKVFERRQPETRSRLRVKNGDDYTLLNLVVRPLAAGPDGGRLAIVIFEDAGEPLDTAGSESAPPTNDQRILDLEYELNSNKESLQTSIEELETSNEELKSANEELQSTNEELQSSNEELETSKEELQSINEELITVNSELQLKLDELAQANSDVINLLSSTTVATVFLDNRLRIKRFTSNVGKVVNLISSDIGRHIGDIALKLSYQTLAVDSEEVLQTLAIKERELTNGRGGWYLMRISPYRTISNVIDGVVITFVDVTEFKKQSQAAEALQEYADQLLMQMPFPAAVLGHKGQVMRANQGWKNLFYDEGETMIGEPVYASRFGRWDVDSLKNFMRQQLPAAEWGVELASAGREPRTARVAARRISIDMAAVEGETEFILMTASEPPQARDD